MNSSTSSLKVTVNGKKYLITGIQKETSCKGLLCAIAKVTSKEEFQIRATTHSVKSSEVVSNENLLERFKGDRKEAGDLTSLNVFNSLSRDAKIVVKDTVTAHHKELHIIDDSNTLGKQVQTSNSKHSSHKRSKKQKTKESAQQTLTTKEIEKSEKKAKQKLLKKQQKEIEKQTLATATTTTTKSEKFLETTLTTLTTTKHSKKRHKVKKHRSVDDSDIESYRRDNLLRHKTKKRTYYDDSDVDVYKTLERIVIDQTKKLNRIQTHTKEVKKTAWMKELTRNSQIYFIDDVAADASGRIVKGEGGGSINHINAETCLFEKDDGNDSGLPSPEYDSSESQENQPIKTKDTLPRDLLHKNNNTKKTHHNNVATVIEDNNTNFVVAQAQITTTNTATKKQTTKELQIPPIRSDDNNEFVKTTTCSAYNNKNNRKAETNAVVNKTIMSAEEQEDNNNNNINIITTNDKTLLTTQQHQSTLTAQHIAIQQNKNDDEEKSSVDNQYNSSNNLSTSTSIKDHSIRNQNNHNNTCIVSENRKEEIITSNASTTGTLTLLRQNCNSNQNNTVDQTEYAVTHEQLTASETVEDTESSELNSNSSVKLVPTSVELHNTSNENNSICKNTKHSILTLVDKNDNIILSTTHTIQEEEERREAEKKAAEVDEYLQTMKLDRNRNLLSESKCDLQVSKMVEFNKALFKGSVSSATFIGNAKKQEKKRVRKSDISTPVLLSPGSFKKHQSLKKVQSVLGKQAADVLKRDILKSFPQLNKNGEEVQKDEKSEQKEKEKYYNKKLKEIRRSKKGKNKSSSTSKSKESSNQDDTEYLPKSQFTDSPQSPKQDDLTTKPQAELEGDEIVKSNSVTDVDFITQEQSSLKTTTKAIDEIDKGIINVVSNDPGATTDAVTAVDEEDVAITNHITTTTPTSETEMLEKICQQKSLTADEIFNEILEYERNIKCEFNEIVQADEEQQNEEQQKQQQRQQQKRKNHNNSLKIKHDLSTSSSTKTSSSSSTTTATKTSTKSPPELQHQKDNTRTSSTTKSPQVDLVNKQNSKLSNSLSSTQTKQPQQQELINQQKQDKYSKSNKKFLPSSNQSSAETQQQRGEQIDVTTSETNGSTDDSTARMSLIKEYLREKQALDELSDKLLDYNYVLSKLTDELEILSEEQDQNKSIKDLEDDEKQICKEIDNVKSMVRSVTDLTSYQRKEISENLEMLDNIDLEIRTRKANYENLRNGTWKNNSQSAPRSLIKNAKVKRRNAHMGISNDDNNQRKSSSFV